MQTTQYNMNTIGAVDPLLRNVLAIYTSKQYERPSSECSGLNVSELTAVLKSFHPGLFIVETPVNKAVIHYCRNTPTTINPKDDLFPASDFSICALEHLLAKRKQFPASPPFLRFIAEAPQTLRLFVPNNPNPPLELLQTFYYCIRLRMLNAKGLLRDIYERACEKEDYSKASSIARPYKSKANELYTIVAETSPVPRSNITDPRVFATKLRNYPKIWTYTEGNLLVKHYGIPFLSSVAMSCLDEDSFCEAMVTYLIGILNQPHSWMRYEMTIDLLRTFTAALEIHSIRGSITKQAFMECAEDYKKNYSSDAIYEKFKLLDDIKRLSNCSHPLFFGYITGAGSSAKLNDIVRFLENVSFAFAKRCRKQKPTPLVPFDRDVFYYHWDRLFEALGMPLRKRNRQRDAYREKFAPKEPKSLIYFEDNNGTLIPNMDDIALKKYILGFHNTYRTGLPPHPINPEYILDVEEIIVGDNHVPPDYFQRKAP